MIIVLNAHKNARCFCCPPNRPLPAKTSETSRGGLGPGAVAGGVLTHDIAGGTVARGLVGHLLGAQETLPLRPTTATAPGSDGCVAQKLPKLNGPCVLSQRLENSFGAAPRIGGVRAFCGGGA